MTGAKTFTLSPKDQDLLRVALADAQAFRNCDILSWGKEEQAENESLIARYKSLKERLL